MPVQDLTQIAKLWPAGWFLHGQCRLVLSGSTLVLQPYHGNFLIVDGAPREIPDAGLSLPPNGLIPSTTYYIYAGWDTTIAVPALYLVASSTGHVTQPGLGVETKSDDPRLTLVGMARLMGAGQWADSATQLFVLSWFNRRPKIGSAFFTALRSTSSQAAWVELDPEIRVEFLCWANDGVLQTIAGDTNNSTGGKVCNSACSFDGVAGPATAGRTQSNLDWVPFAISWFRTDLSEGYHYSTLLGAAHDLGTANWDFKLAWGINFPTIETTNSIVVQG